MKDSIFWGNEANEGTQITIGTGFEFDPQPSRLTIAYSDVGSYPSANAIFRGAGCQLSTGAGIFSQNPQFRTSLTEDLLNTVWQYYLDQQLSPCKDAGSRPASDAGLGGYTTSINGARDKGVVDLGYHYFVSARAQCGTIDEALVLSGKIDIDDLVDFLEEWMTSENCSESNGWCSGSDLNYDGAVDFEDMASLTTCWLVEDNEPPYPNPVKWVVEPNATTNVWGAIDMEAETVHDAWWPDANIRYKFVCIDPVNTAYNSAWITTPWWSETGLPVQTYKYAVKAKDGSGNETVLDENLYRTVTPGDWFVMPAPQWEIEPFVTATNQIPMELYTYAELDAMAEGVLTDLPADDDNYRIYYQFSVKGTGVDFTADWQLSPAWTDIGPTDPANGYVNGQVYTYTGTMQLTYGGSPSEDTAVKIGLPTTVTFALTFVPGDLNAPLPNPAEHTATSPYQASFGGVYYHVITAVQATDVDALGAAGPPNENVEYKFVCVEEPGYSSGGSYDTYGIEWRNVDNVAGLRYPNNILQVPEQYFARVGVPSSYSWYIIVRDRSPNQNRTAAVDNTPTNDPLYPLCLAQVKQVQ